MSVLIKGMDMPMVCRTCQFLLYINHYDELGVCGRTRKDVTQIKDKRDEDCPLVEIPTKHGRLIDADSVIKYWKPDHSRQFVADYFIHTLETANTVIEAESEQENTGNKRKTGKWKAFEYDGATFYECPKCEETGNVPTPFCPFCGEKLW